MTIFNNDIVKINANETLADFSVERDLIAFIFKKMLSQEQIDAVERIDLKYLPGGNSMVTHDANGQHTAWPRPNGMWYFEIEMDINFCGSVNDDHYLFVLGHELCHATQWASGLSEYVTPELVSYDYCEQVDQDIVKIRQATEMTWKGRPRVKPISDEAYLADPAENHADKYAERLVSKFMRKRGKQYNYDFREARGDRYA